MAMISMRRETVQYLNYSFFSLFLSLLSYMIKFSKLRNTFCLFLFYPLLPPLLVSRENVNYVQYCRSGEEELFMEQLGANSA
jgi:hypothetical protein